MTAGAVATREIKRRGGTYLYAVVCLSGVARRSRSTGLGYLPAAKPAAR